MLQPPPTLRTVVLVRYRDNHKLGSLWWSPNGAFDCVSDVEQLGKLLEQYHPRGAKEAGQQEFQGENSDTLWNIILTALLVGSFAFDIGVLLFVLWYLLNSWNIAFLVPWITHSVGKTIGWYSAHENFSKESRLVEFHLP